MAAAQVMSRPTERLKLLSTPRALPAAFHEDRLSVYWENENYKKPKRFSLSKRQEELVKCKRCHPDYRPDRISPIWPVSMKALTAVPTPRILELARPKGTHPNYYPDKQVRTIVPDTALQYCPTRRISELAQHKKYQPLKIKSKTEWEWGEWLADSASLIPTASERVRALSEPKCLNHLFVSPRQVQWEVSKEAKNYTASEKILNLARPKNKHADMEDYDPHTYVVSRAALLAQASPRISELATPIPRKVRAKK